MTAVGAPRPSATELARPQASRPAGLSAEDRRAWCQELLHPYIADYSGFARVIAAEAAKYWGRPRLLDFGCGTGAVAIPILSQAHDLDYQGFDPSEAMVRIFRRKTTKVERPRRVLTLTAPMDPRRRDVPASVFGGTTELLLVADFLQHVPLAAPSDDRHGRVALLRALRRLLRPGGKLFIIEDVLGDTSEEEARLENLWNHLMVTRVRPAFETHLLPYLERVDPEVLELTRRMLTRPALARDLRERLRREPHRQRLPLAAWTRLFDHFGWRYRVLRHQEVGNLYLFTIEGPDSATRAAR